MTLVIIIDTHKIIWGGCQEERLKKIWQNVNDW